MNREHSRPSKANRTLSTFKPIFPERKLNPFAGFMRNCMAELQVLLTTSVPSTMDKGKAA